MQKKSIGIDWDPCGAQEQIPINLTYHEYIGIF